MSVENQYSAKVNKDACDKNNLYTTNNLKAMQAAMNALTGQEFKVWLYFAKNQNGYTFEVSPADATQWGIPKGTWRKAFAKLREYGYLVETSKNHFDFYETPKEPKIIITVHKEEDGVDEDMSDYIF